MNLIWYIRKRIKFKFYYGRQLSFETWSDYKVYLVKYYEDRQFLKCGILSVASLYA